MKKLFITIILTLFLATVCNAYEYCITIPDAETTNLVTAIAANYNYQTDISSGVEDPPTIPNPESKVDFAKRMVRKWIANEYIRYWGIIPGEAAKQSAIDAAEAKMNE